jgi:hypothetical protein
MQQLVMVVSSRTGPLPMHEKRIGPLGCLPNFFTTGIEPCPHGKLTLLKRPGANAIVQALSEYVTASCLRLALVASAVRRPVHGFGEPLGLTDWREV